MDRASFERLRDEADAFRSGRGSKNGRTFYDLIYESFEEVGELIGRARRLQGDPNKYEEYRQAILSANKYFSEMCGQFGNHPILKTLTEGFDTEELGRLGEYKRIYDKIKGLEERKDRVRELEGNVENGMEELAGSIRVLNRSICEERRHPPEDFQSIVNNYGNNSGNTPTVNSGTSGLPAKISQVMAVIPSEVRDPSRVASLPLDKRVRYRNDCCLAYNDMKQMLPVVKREISSVSTQIRSLTSSLPDNALGDMDDFISARHPVYDPNILAIRLDSFKIKLAKMMGG